MTQKRLGIAVDSVCTKNLNKAYNGRGALFEGGCEVFVSTVNLKFAVRKWYFYGNEFNSTSFQWRREELAIKYNGGLSTFIKLNLI